MLKARDCYSCEMLARVPTPARKDLFFGMDSSYATRCDPCRMGWLKANNKALCITCKTVLDVTKGRMPPVGYHYDAMMNVHMCHPCYDRKGKEISKEQKLASALLAEVEVLTNITVPDFLFTAEEFRGIASVLISKASKPRAFVVPARYKSASLPRPPELITDKTVEEMFRTLASFDSMPPSMIFDSLSKSMSDKWVKEIFGDLIPDQCNYCGDPIKEEPYTLKRDETRYKMCSVECRNQLASEL